MSLDFARSTTPYAPNSRGRSLPRRRRCAQSSAAEFDRCHDRGQRRHFSAAPAPGRRGDDRVQAVNFIASDAALRVMAEELGLKGRGNLVGRILQSADLRIPRKHCAKITPSKTSSKIKEQSNADIGANVASGSYPADAMIVIPCSVGTLARIANGIASHLIERAADVSLKEKRPLVLCVRETPLNKIHIRNMYRAADAGATIFPLIPAFYYGPASLDEHGARIRLSRAGSSGPSPVRCLSLERLTISHLRPTFKNLSPTEYRPQEGDFSVESQRCRSQMPAGHVERGKLARCMSRPRFPKSRSRSGWRRMRQIPGRYACSNCWCAKMVRRLLLVSRIVFLRRADRSQSLCGRRQGGEGGGVRVPHQLRTVSWAGRAWRRARARSDAGGEEAHALRRRHVSGDQQRHSGDSDAGQRDQRSGRRHDR